MSKKVDLLKENEFKLLIKYMVPCILGMLGLSFCILIDTIFIGKKLGSTGLAALNLSLPTYNIFNALALTFGIGGATALSISIGEGNHKKGNEIFTTSILGAVCVCIVISILNIFFIDEICYALGASEITFPYVKSYVEVILFFNWSFVFISVLNVFVRCDKAPKLAMTAMITANITNIILDYLFIFPLNLGLGGAALATSIGQIAGILILLLHFVKRNNTMSFKIKYFNFNSFLRIIKNGIPSFITELSAGYVIFIFNLAIFNMLGDLGVSSYSIINNIILIFTAVFYGLAQGVQPLVSVNYGSKNYSRVSKFLKLSSIIALILGIVFFSLCILFPKSFIGLFTNDTGTLLNTTVAGSKIYFFCLLFSGINMVNIGYLQAIEHSKKALLLSLFRGIIFITMYLLVLPKVLGVTGIWLSVPVTEFTTLIISLILVHKKAL